MPPRPPQCAAALFQAGSGGNGTKHSPHDPVRAVYNTGREVEYIDSPCTEEAREAHRRPVSISYAMSYTPFQIINYSIFSNGSMIDVNKAKLLRDAQPPYLLKVYLYKSE